jgi:hypothetical protein
MRPSNASKVSGSGGPGSLSKAAILASSVHAARPLRFGLKFALASATLFIVLPSRTPSFDFATAENFVRFRTFQDSPSNISVTFLLVKAQQLHCRGYLLYSLYIRAHPEDEGSLLQGCLNPQTPMILVIFMQNRELLVKAIVWGPSTPLG